MSRWRWVGIAGIFLLLMALAALAYWWHPVQHWVAIHTGTDNESAGYYGFWSGFGSDIGEVTILAGVIGLYRSHNCHQPGCWRLAKHETSEGYKLCRKCIACPKDDLNLHPIHPDHQ